MQLAGPLVEGWRQTSGLAIAGGDLVDYVLRRWKRLRQRAAGSRKHCLKQWHTAEQALREAVAHDWIGGTHVLAFT
jgi:hypothetical protein